MGTAQILIDAKLSEIENDGGKLETKVAVMGNGAEVISMLCKIFEESPEFFTLCHMAVHHHADMEEQREMEEQAKKEEEEKKRAAETPETVAPTKTFTITLPKIETKEDLTKALHKTAAQVKRYFESEIAKLENKSDK